MEQKFFKFQDEIISIQEKVNRVKALQEEANDNDSLSILVTQILELESYLEQRGR